MSLNGPPTHWRRCEDNAQPPAQVAAALLALWLANEPLVYEGERYAAAWRLAL